ncbi:MAG: replicative DNA helicase [Acidobacteria bacterium]|nr:MAG: replicative DNA helicase [Acidobacteriota bacterium]
MPDVLTKKAESRAPQRALPHSEEAERAVLAGVLLKPDLLPLVSGRLVAEDFYLERHQLLYRALLELAAENVAVDLRTVQARLEQAGLLEAAGGLAYLVGLDLDLPDLGRLEAYAEIVKERSLRRRLILASIEITNDCFDGGLEAREALAKAEQSILSIGEEAIHKGFTPLKEVYEATLAHLEERASGEMVGLSTGFHDWDARSQGLADGNLIIIAGRPGMGKTSLALNVAQHVAIRQHQAVGMFSLEMSETELSQRVLASEANLPFAQVRAGRLSEKQWARLYDVVRETSAAPLYIDDSPNPSLLELASKARRLKREKDLKLLIVDYLQLMQAGGRFESRQLEIAAISRGLKQLAKELSIPIIALSQLSRQPERRSGDHRPQLADLRESGSLEQDADMVCFVYRDELYNKDDPENKGLAELIMAKHRHGETGTIELVFLGEITSFKNLDRRHAGQEPPPDLPQRDPGVPF